MLQSNSFECYYLLRLDIVPELEQGIHLYDTEVILLKSYFRGDIVRSFDYKF